MLSFSLAQKGKGAREQESKRGPAQLQDRQSERRRRSGEEKEEKKVVEEMNVSQILLMTFASMIQPKRNTPTTATLYCKNDRRKGTGTNEKEKRQKNKVNNKPLVRGGEINLMIKAKPKRFESGI